MYLSIYSQYRQTKFQEHNTFLDAKGFLKSESDSGALYEIAIYDLSSKQIVWSNEKKISEENINKHVNKSLTNYHEKNKD
jgi:hypothetical protein